ncbi:MAG: tetratricopeptide repeat protein [Spirulinaceae cyanobacterium]
MGRADDLNAIHAQLEALEPPNIVVVVGMAGVGKTELAIQYGRSHFQDYPGGVTWFAAEDFGAALQDWLQVEFCPDRDLRALSTVRQRMAVGWQAWSQFCADRPALIIVDDVSNYREQIEPYLPQSPADRASFRFLLTSRLHPSSPTPIPMQEIRELDSDAAVALLARFAGQARIETERPTANTVCERLANLPLAITLVGCWLSWDADRTLSELITALEKEGLDAPALERDQDMMQLTAERGLKAAFAISWQQLETRSVDAQQLARVLSLFAPADIAWEWVTAVVDTYGQLNPPPQQAATPHPAPTGWLARWQRIWQQIKRWLGLQPAPRPLPPPPVPIAHASTARDALNRLSLLQTVGSETKVYRLHPLLQEFFSQQWQSTHDRNGWSLAFAQTFSNYARQILSETSRKETAQNKAAETEIVLEKAAQYRPLQPHFTLAQQIWQEQARASHNPDNKATYRRQANDIRTALFHLSQPMLLAITFETARKTHDAAKAALARGDQVAARQKFAETLAAYNRVIEQARAALPADSFQLAGYLRQTATLFRELGQYREGIPLAKEAVDMITDRAELTTLAGYLNDLASLYYYQGSYSEAEPLFARSLAILEQQLGRDHPDVANSLNNLASLYHYQGSYSEAEPLFAHSLFIWEQQLGRDHPDVATSLNNLALLYQTMGRYSEAEPLFACSLSIQEQQLGSDHPDVANSLNNLAGLYQSMGRYSEAEPLYLRCLEIRVKTLPETHPKIQTGLNNFVGMVQAALAAGQADQLSDHPMTQAILQQLNDRSSED